MNRVFQRLYEKEIRKVDKDDAMQNIVITTCLLEKEFPTTCLDIMTHLPTYLVEQLFVCGLVHYKWMYPIE